MKLNRSLRKLVYALHVILSVGWLGAVLAYIPLAIIGLKSQDSQMIKGAYLMMNVIGSYVLVPSSFAALLTGLVQSLGTGWGLVRYYWILVKLALTVIATFILFRHMNAVSQMAEIAAAVEFPPAEHDMLRSQLLVHAVLGVIVLILVTVISVYKPWGRTPFRKTSAV